MRGVVLVCIALGVASRFYRIGEKPYWFDESITSLTVGGHGVDSVIERCYTGKPVSAETITQFLRVDPSTRLRDVVAPLVREDPKHPPLYYITMRLWTMLAGDSPAAMRIPAAVFSLAAIPLAFWLARELFPGAPTAVAWWAMALVALSPIEILYAQEARQYSLWNSLTFFASAALLRAQRRDTIGAWALYCIACVISLYTHTLFLIVLLAHFVYVMLSRPSRRSFARFALTLTIAAVVFAPWAWKIWQAREMMATTNAAWLSEAPYSRPNLLGRFAYSIGLAFVDLFAFPPRVPKSRIAPVILAGLTIAAISLAGALRANRRARWFMIVMILAPIVLLLLPDLLVGGRRSTNPRYLIPMYIALTLAAAYACAGAGRVRWRAVFGDALILLGLISAIAYHRATDWWSKGDGSGILALTANVINRSPHPLVFSNVDETKVGSLLAVVQLVRPDVEFLLWRDPHSPPNLLLAPGRAALLLTDHPVSRVRRTRYPFTLVPTSSRMIWRIQPPPSD